MMTLAASYAMANRRPDGTVVGGNPALSITNDGCDPRMTRSLDRTRAGGDECA